MRRNMVVGLALALIVSATGCGTHPSSSKAEAAPKASLRVSSTTTVTPPADENLGPALGVDFVDAKHGFVLRQRGALEATSDGGLNWNIVKDLPAIVPDGVIFFSPTTGIVFGQNAACGNVSPGCASTIFRTTDGGATFTSVLTLPDVRISGWTSWGVAGAWLAATTANCFSNCTPQAVLYASDDAGLAWAKRWSAPSPAVTILETTDGQSGFAVAGGSLLRVKGGGTAMAKLASLDDDHGPGYPIASGQGSIDVVPPSTLYVTACDTNAAANGGCENYLYRLTDAATTVSMLWHGYCTYHSDVKMHSAKSGILILMGTPACGPYAPGQESPPTNDVLSTSNGFRTKSTAFAFPDTIQAVDFLNGSTGWAVGNPYGDCSNIGPCLLVTFETTDGGLTWQGQPAVAEPTGAVAALPGGGFLGIGEAAGDPLAILKSADGTSWRKIGDLPPKAAAGGSLPGVFAFGSPDVGYLVAGPSLFRTTDGGRTFTPVDLPKGDIAVSVVYALGDELVMEAVTGPGCAGGTAPSDVCHEVLLGSHDDGATFRQVASWRVKGATYNVAFSSPAVGYRQAICPASTCLMGYRLFYTTNGGKSWHRMKNALPFAGNAAPILLAGSQGTVVMESSQGFAVLGKNGWEVFDMTPGGYAVAVQAASGEALVLPSNGAPFLTQW